MTKTILPKFKRWTTDEKRLLVISLLTLIYPVFVTSFYALYLFVLMPFWVSQNISVVQAHHDGWYHGYWLFVSLLWIILCAIILPFFKKKKVQHVMNLSTVENPPYDRKIHTEPVIKVEVKGEEDSKSKLSGKSENSSGNIKKEGSDLDMERRDSFRSSRESIRKSCTSLEREKLTQSGEFLNDFMSTLQSEEAVKNETVCEVHAEENRGHVEAGIDSDHESLDKERNRRSTKMGLKPTEVETNLEKYREEADTVEKPPDNKKDHFDKDSHTSSKDSSSDEDPEPDIVAQAEKCPQIASPLKINEATVEQQEDTEDLDVAEEADKLDSDVPQRRHKKATPTIDTSRASGYYECSMPTPNSMETASPQNNTVFLYVNPDTAATDDSILVSHGGEVQESEVKEVDV